MGKFIVKQSNSGGYVFSLKANNGQVIATSQTYKTLSSCIDGIKSVQTNVPLAALEDQTADDMEAQKNPKFEMYADEKGEIRFRLKAKNGQIIATGKGYKTTRSCLNGIASIIKNVTTATIVHE